MGQQWGVFISPMVNTLFITPAGWKTENVTGLRVIYFTLYRFWFIEYWVLNL